MKTDVIGVELLAGALDKIPVGITIISTDGLILYYNEFCARYVDRKPEYIGKDIRSCHKKSESIQKIDHILEKLKQGEIQEYYYESTRDGNKLSVTVSPFEFNNNPIGFIQSFSINR